MNTDIRALMVAFRKHPDEGTRAVLADALEEIGREREASRLRRQTKALGEWTYFASVNRVSGGEYKWMVQLCMVGPDSYLPKKWIWESPSFSSPTLWAIYHDHAGQLAKYLTYQALEIYHEQMFHVLYGGLHMTIEPPVMDMVTFRRSQWIGEFPKYEPPFLLPKDL